MRVARGLLYALAALIVLVIAGSWVVPQFLDWNRYRGTIADFASSTLGRNVHISGPISLALLPEPVLTAADIEVTDASGGARLTARALRLRVALLPLLGGHVDARDLTLASPDLHLPWPISFRPAAARPPSWLSGLRAHVERGQLEIGAVAVSDVVADVTTDSLTGTLHASGLGQIEGRLWHFDVRLSRPGADGSAAIDLAIDGQGPMADTGGSLTGQFASDGSLQGRVTAEGPNLSLLIPAPAVAWRADGRLSASGGLAVADDLALQINGSPAHGAVALRLTPALRLDLALAASRIDLDAWLPVLLRAPSLVVPTGIDLSAEAATFGGGELRRLRAGFDLTASGFSLHDASALLPGDADLRLKGVMTRTQAGAPAFQGDATVAAPDLRTTLRWLGAFGLPALTALPPGPLRTASLTGHLVLTPGELTFAALTGSLDAAPLSGALQIRFGPRLALQVALALPSLDLDPWLNHGASELSALPRIGAAFDLTLRLQADRAAWEGITAQHVTLEADADAKGLALQRLAADVQNAQLALSGAIASDGRVADARLTLDTPQIGSIARLLPATWQAPALLQGPASLRIQASGPSNALVADLHLALADGRLDAQPTIDLSAETLAGPVTLVHPGAARLLQMLGLRRASDWLGDGSLSLRAGLVVGPSRLVATDVALTAGSLRATGNLEVNHAPDGASFSGTIRAETLPLPAPHLRAAEPLDLPDMLAALPHWRGALRVEAGQVLLGLMPFLANASAAVGFDDRTLRIDGLTATLDGGDLAATLALQAGAEPPRLTLDAKLDGGEVTAPLFGLPVDLTSGRLDTSVDVSAAGHSAAALLATLSGRVQADAHDGTVSGFNLAALRSALLPGTASAAQAAAAKAVAGGTTPFDALHLEGALNQGALTIRNAQLRSADGTAALSGSADLASGQLSLRIALRPAVPDAPEISVLLSGPQDQPERVPEIATLARWLAERQTQ